MAVIQDQNLRHAALTRDWTLALYGSGQLAFP
jgi:hypothetical protein